MSEYYIGQIFKVEYPQGAADWCNENQTAIIMEIEPTTVEGEEVRQFQIVAVPVYTPTKEEQSAKREIAYVDEVDPITCHINRLKDEEQTPEIEQEIEALKQERSVKVEEIKERYPYPPEE